MARIERKFKPLERAIVLEYLAEPRNTGEVINRFSDYHPVYVIQTLENLSDEGWTKSKKDGLGGPVTWTRHNICETPSLRWREFSRDGQWITLIGECADDELMISVKDEKTLDSELERMRDIIRPPFTLGDEREVLRLWNERQAQMVFSTKEPNESIDDLFFGEVSA
jgi:hypothetical protein